MRSRVALGAALMCATVFLAGPLTVAAHAQLVSSDPADGSTLTGTPFALSATFSEELSEAGSSIIIENESGAQVASGGVSADDATTMTADLPTLPAGQYTVRWTAVTADDQAVERGTYSFHVASEAGSPATSPAPSAAPSDPDQGDRVDDLLVALVIAAFAIASVIGFLILRNRR